MKLKPDGHWYLLNPPTCRYWLFTKVNGNFYYDFKLCWF